MGTAADPLAALADPTRRRIVELLSQGPRTAGELADKAGISVQVVHDLLSFSMIRSRRIGDDHYFDDDALEVATACRNFIAAGIEIRHLRMYKIAAEREAGVLEQLVMPLVKQRNPDAKMQALATVNDLADAGARLHAALLQAALDDALG
jgi:DNA-binding transcriptional ArsR family regulator